MGLAVSAGHFAIFVNYIEGIVNAAGMRFRQGAGNNNGFISRRFGQCFDNARSFLSVFG